MSSIVQTRHNLCTDIYSICIFEGGRCQYRDLFNLPERAFESNVGYTLRFMLDTEVRWQKLEESISIYCRIPGMAWVKVPAKRYTLVTELNVR
jgi:hypothetical protein